EKADREAAARAALDAAERRVRDDAIVRVDLPDPAVATARRIATIGPWTMQGPERVALVGPNGIGKTTLLEKVLAEHLHTDRVGYLPQRLDGLDETATVLENVRAAS